MLSNHSIKFQTFHVSYIVKTRHPCFSYIPVCVYIYITKRTITIYKEKEKHLPILGPFPTVPDFSPDLLSRVGCHSNNSHERDRCYLIRYPETFLFTYANPFQSSSSPFRGIDSTNFSFWPTSSRARSCLPDLGSPIREPTERDFEGMKSGNLS